MEKQKQIMVGLEDYIELAKRDAKLNFLEGGGVDNWSGYGESLYPDECELDDIDKEYEDIEARIRKEYK